MMSVLKRNKRKIILFLLLAYIIQAVPVYLIKNSIVDLDPEPEEITFLHNRYNE